MQRFGNEQSVGGVDSKGSKSVGGIDSNAADRIHITEIPLFSQDMTGLRGLEEYEKHLFKAKAKK